MTEMIDPRALVHLEAAACKAKELLHRIAITHRAVTAGNTDSLPFFYEMICESQRAFDFWLSEFEKVTFEPKDGSPKA